MHYSQDHNNSHESEPDHMTSDGLNASEHDDDRDPLLWNETNDEPSEDGAPLSVNAHPPVFPIHWSFRDKALVRLEHLLIVNFTCSTAHVIITIIDLATHAKMKVILLPLLFTSIGTLAHTLYATHLLMRHKLRSFFIGRLIMLLVGIMSTAVYTVGAVTVIMAGSGWSMGVQLTLAFISSFYNMAVVVPEMFSREIKFPQYYTIDDVGNIKKQTWGFML